jgi:tetraacyldisaccharide 4'-kinase
VGNLTVGGSGKTPLTLWLAGELRKRDIKVGIVLRGYGGRAQQPGLVARHSSAEDVGDEALLLARRSGCPVAVGRDRVAAARLLVEQGVELILADDGLQHLRLKRDLEIVVVDGERRFGNGRLLPAGPLREPVGRLKTVDVVVVNGARGEAGELSYVLQSTDALSLISNTSRPLKEFGMTPVHAVAGIGNPERFFRMLEGHGLQVMRHPFADHHAFQSEELKFTDDLPVLMTEKDAVKCSRFAGPEHWCVPVEAVMQPPQAQRLMGSVLALLSGRTRR